IVLGLIRSWYDTLEFMTREPIKAEAIMAERAGITPEELQQFKTGTKIFTIADNLEAFSPGTTMAHLSFAAQKVAQFMFDIGLISEIPDLTQIFDPRFVRAYAQSLKL
ncbi:MAG: aliphatic sulfonates ABC transporter substrate-binding protein, partial [Cyanobacteria bacterium J06623_7]